MRLINKSEYMSDPIKRIFELSLARFRKEGCFVADREKERLLQSRFVKVIIVPRTNVRTRYRITSVCDKTKKIVEIALSVPRGAKQLKAQTLCWSFMYAFCDLLNIGQNRAVSMFQTCSARAMADVDRKGADDLAKFKSIVTAAARRQAMLPIKDRNEAAARKQLTRAQLRLAKLKKSVERAERRVKTLSVKIRKYERDRSRKIETSQFTSSENNAERSTDGNDQDHGHSLHQM